MAKEDLIETTATVTEVLPDARYRVKLDNGYELIAYTNVSITSEFSPAIKFRWKSPRTT